MTAGARSRPSSSTTAECSRSQRSRASPGLREFRRGIPGRAITARLLRRRLELRRRRTRGRPGVRRVDAATWRPPGEIGGSSSGAEQYVVDLALARARRDRTRGPLRISACSGLSVRRRRSSRSCTGRWSIGHARAPMGCRLGGIPATNVARRCSGSRRASRSTSCSRSASTERSRERKRADPDDLRRRKPASEWASASRDVPSTSCSPHPATTGDGAQRRLRRHGWRLRDLPHGIRHDGQFGLVGTPRAPNCVAVDSTRRAPRRHVGAARATDRRIRRRRVHWRRSRQGCGLRGWTGAAIERASWPDRPQPIRSGSRGPQAANGRDGRRVRRRSSASRRRAGSRPRRRRGAR